MKFGLSESEYNFLHQHLVERLARKGLTVYIFGSRSTGKNHPFSDVDILLEGDFTAEVEKEILSVKDFFEESNFPYKVDLVRMKDLAQSYHSSVMRDRIRL